MPRQKSIGQEGFTFDTKGNVVLPQVKEKTHQMVLNGIIDGFLGPGMLGVPGLDGVSGYGGAVNSIATLWQNNRWYLASNFRQLLAESYIEHGIIRTIVDVPVHDAFKGGIEIHTKELEPEQVEELTAWMREEGDLGKIAQTSKWNRLFGGGGTVINVDQDPSKPLDLNKKITRFELYAADLWEFPFNHQNTADYSLSLDTNYQMEHVDFFDFYGKKLHRSRVLLQKGIEAPSLIRPRMRGWGVSVVEVLINSLNQYLKGKKVLFEILDEFKVDYYKIRDYAASLMNPQAYAAINKRLAHTNRTKNYQNSVIMDKDDDWMQRQLSFAGLAEIGQEVRMQVASEMRMPMSKIFGISAQGFSSGQDDIENYNSMVEGEIRTPTEFQVLKIVKIRCILMFGFVPKDLKIKFKPLRILSAEQEENVKTQQHSRALASFQAGGMSLEEYRQDCNKAQVFSIQVDNEDGTLERLEKEKKEKETEASKPAGEGKTPASTKKAPEAKT